MLRTSLLLGLLTVVAVECIYRYYSSLGIILLIAIGLAVYVHWWFGVRIEDAHRPVRPLFALTFLAIAALTLYGTTIELIWLRHIVAIGTGLFVSFTANTLARLRGDIRPRPPVFLHSVSLLAACVVLTTIAFFNALATGLQTTSWWFPLIEAIAVMSILYLAFRAMRISRELLPLTLIITAVFVIEGVWVTSFLPLGSFSRAVLFGAPLVLWFLMERDRLTSTLEPHTFIRWGSMAGVAMFIVLATTRWS